MDSKEKKILIRTATIASSLEILLKGQLEFLNKYYNVIAISGDEKVLSKIKEREGVNTYCISIKRRISILCDIQSLIKLFIYFKKHKPLIVHSITPKAGLLSMMAAYLAKVPIRIHTFTGLVFPYRKGIIHKLLLNMDRLLCYCSTNIYPEGIGVMDDLIKYKVTKKKLKVIGNGNINGIDMKYYDSSLYKNEYNKIRDNLSIGNKDFVFVYVGRLVPEKGIYELIDSFIEINKEYLNIKLLLVGSFDPNIDPIRPQYEDIIKNQFNIIHVGFQEDIRPFLAISNAFIFPSYREGFPNAVLQAASMNLPCIVTNINGCNEIIINRINGLIITPKDKNALIKAMKEIIENNELRDKMFKNARNILSNRYDNKALWNEILKEYRKLEKNIMTV